MSPLQMLRNFAFGENDALDVERVRMMGPMSVVSLVLLVPFMINSIVQGRYLLTLITALLIAVLTTNVLAMRRGRPPPVPYAWLLLPIIAGMGISLVTQGIYGALWGYPVLIFGYFSMPRRTAFWGSVLLLLATTVLTYSSGGPEQAVRVGATLMLTWLMINIVLNTLSDLHDRLVQQATTDPMTGALNRRQMDTALGELVKRARGRPVPASILLVDVDNFKKINDLFGHAAGDEVLVGLVKLFNARKRTADSLYRIGGEEFLLLLPETPVAAASVVAEQLRDMIEQAPLLKDLAVTISIGVAECLPGYAPDQWLQGADAALYRAKESGRNRVENSVFGESAPS